LREKPDPAANIPSPLTGAIARGLRASWCKIGGARLLIPQGRTGTPAPAKLQTMQRSGGVMEHCICWRQDAALTGTLGSVPPHLVEAAILAAS